MAPVSVAHVSETNSPYDSWALRVVWTEDVAGCSMDCLNCFVVSLTCLLPVADHKYIKLI